MELSYVIVTHNRRAALLRTLDILARTTPLSADQWEAWIVDNGSTDSTAHAILTRFPWAHMIRLAHNEGVAARSRAFERINGRCVVLLDDDSYPVGDTVPESIAHLDANPDAGAVVGRCVLPDGQLEACAFPGVMLSGAVCIRRDVLRRVGGFRPEFFRKAGEYDYSFRVWRAGFRIDRREDLIYRHDKSATGRDNRFAVRMDLRNNLILAERFLPAPIRRAYRHDWLLRYGAIGRAAGCDKEVSRAVREARQWAQRQRDAGRDILGPDVLETIFRFNDQQRRVADWATAHGVTQAVIADFGKNLYATWRAAQLAGVRTGAIADNHPAFAGMRCRGAPIMPDASAAARFGCDIPVIVSNINPAQIDDRCDVLRRTFNGPILRLWEPAVVRTVTTSPAQEQVAA